MTTTRLREDLRHQHLGRHLSVAHIATLQIPLLPRSYQAIVPRSLLSLSYEISQVFSELNPDFGAGNVLATVPACMHGTRALKRGVADLAAIDFGSEIWVGLILTTFPRLEAA